MESTIRIERYADQGRCVGHIDGRVVFVRFALPGELVRVVLDEPHDREDRFWTGEVTEVLEASEDRVEPVWPLAGPLAMGGGVGGQRASSAAVDRFETLASRFSRSRTAIGHTIDLAQADVLAIGQELGGVSGTTVTGLIAPGRIERDAPGDVALDINPDMDWYVINIGDSRTYHMDADSDGQWDASTLCRITRDHSRRQEAIDSGEMLPEDAVIIPRNIITQCIGDPDGINPDFFAVRPTGRFIICSDGLHGEVDDAAIAATAAACADPQTAVDELIRIALEAGGTDNVTVIVLDITGEYAGQKVWHASRLAQQEDLETVSDETLDTIRIQKPANQI